MKKRLNFLTIGIVLFCLLLSSCVAKTPESTIQTFNMDDYSYRIEKYKVEDLCVGKIENANDAVEKASVIFEEEFGDFVNEYKPYKALYDEANNCWLVKRDFNKPNYRYASPYVIFDAEGNVIALWISK